MLSTSGWLYIYIYELLSIFLVDQKDMDPT